MNLQIKLFAKHISQAYQKKYGSNVIQPYMQQHYLTPSPFNITILNRTSFYKGCFNFIARFAKGDYVQQQHSTSRKSKKWSDPPITPIKILL
jgi:hypothetical protein